MKNAELAQLVIDFFKRGFQSWNTFDEDGCTMDITLAELADKISFITGNDKHKLIFNKIIAKLLEPYKPKGTNLKFPH